MSGKMALCVATAAFVIVAVLTAPVAESREIAHKPGALRKTGKTRPQRVRFAVPRSPRGCLRQKFAVSGLNFRRERNLLDRIEEQFECLSS